MYAEVIDQAFSKAPDDNYTTIRWHCFRFDSILATMLFLEGTSLQLFIFWTSGYATKANNRLVTIRSVLFLSK